MEYIQDPVFEGNVTVRCTEQEWFARIEKKREQACLRFASNPKAAAQQLYNIAKGDTGGSRAASGLLLSLWNDNYAVNMRDVICTLDIANSEAAIALLKTLGPGHHLERYLTQDQIVRVIDVWGEFHERRKATA